MSIAQADVVRIADKFSFREDYKAEYDPVVIGKSGIERKFDLILTSNRSEAKRIAVFNGIPENLVEDLAVFNEIAEDCGINLKVLLADRRLDDAELSLVQKYSIVTIGSSSILQEVKAELQHLSNLKFSASTISAGYVFGAFLSGVFLISRLPSQAFGGLQLNYYFSTLLPIIFGILELVVLSVGYLSMSMAFSHLSTSFPKHRELYNSTKRWTIILVIVASVSTVVTGIIYLEGWTTYWELPILSLGEMIVLAGLVPAMFAISYGILSLQSWKLFVSMAYLTEDTPDVTQLSTWHNIGTGLFSSFLWIPFLYASRIIHPGLASISAISNIVQEIWHYFPLLVATSMGGYVMSVWAFRGISAKINLSDEADEGSAGTLTEKKMQDS
jgi:hypothetical protein